MVTTQAFRRLAALVLATAALGSAVRAGDWLPLLPDQDFYDFQLFAPPDLQEYGVYHRPSEGIFFSYDRLYWSVTVPRVREVGTTDTGRYLIPSQPISPQAIVQLNNGGIIGSGTAGGSVIGGIFIYGADPLELDLNTSWMRTGMTWGNRYEGGWIYDEKGMLFSYFDTGNQKQTFQTMSEFAASSPTQIFTQTTTSGATGGFGTTSTPLTSTTITSNSPPPDHLVAQKLTQTNSSEIMSVVLRRSFVASSDGAAVGPRCDSRLVLATCSLPTATVSGTRATSMRGTPDRPAALRAAESTSAPLAVPSAAVSARTRPAGWLARCTAPTIPAGCSSGPGC